MNIIELNRKELVERTEEQLYFVTESKGSVFDEHLRLIEKGKIHCGKEHFKSIGSRMIVAHTIDDVYSQV